MASQPWLCKIISILQVLNRGMRDGYHTAKVVWIKDEPIPADEIGNVA